MAASLLLGRQGILFGLKLSNLNKCSWATHPWQDHARHFFLSPWSLGKCCHSSIKTVFVLVWGQPQNDATVEFHFSFVSFYLSRANMTSIQKNIKLVPKITSSLQNQHSVWHPQRCPAGDSCQSMIEIACGLSDLENDAVINNSIFIKFTHNGAQLCL